MSTYTNTAAAVKPAGTHALLFIYITMLLDVIGLGIIIPVLPKLIAELIYGDMSSAAQWGGFLMFAYATMQFVCAPLLGGLSDRFGRRPVILFSLLGFGVDYLFQGFAPTIGWLFVGRIIAGITGASYTTATAYIADISAPEKRAQNFGMIGAIFGVGFILGPVIGGILGHYGPRVPFYASAVLALLNFTYGLIVLPESLSAENRRAFDLKRANPLGSLLRLRNYPVVLSLLGGFVCIYLAGNAHQSTWSYFTMLKFHWNEKWVGYSLGFVGLMIALVQGGLTRVLVPTLGQRRSIIIGLLFYILGYLLFAFAWKAWMMFAFMVPFALGGLAGPSLQGMISSSVPANEQGELQGSLTSMISLTSIFGPLLMTNLFSYFTSKTAPVFFPGAPFLMGAILTFMSFLFIWRSFKLFPNRATTPAA